MTNTQRQRVPTTPQCSRPLELAPGALPTNFAQLKPEELKADLEEIIKARHGDEISKLIGGVERKGYTLVPLSLYWKRGRAKLKIALAKGKKQHDKRASIRQREWDRDAHRLMKLNR